MRELKRAELDAVAAGASAEFRTIVRHEIPRFDEPPAGLDLEQADHSTHVHTCTPPRWSPPKPVPMHWLPPNGSGPQEY